MLNISHFISFFKAVEFKYPKGGIEVVEFVETNGKNFSSLSCQAPFCRRRILLVAYVDSKVAWDAKKNTFCKVVSWVRLEGNIERYIYSQEFIDYTFSGLSCSKFGLLEE